jgi:hypothetical protein
MEAPRKRNKPSRPKWSHSGITHELWRDDTNRVSWAQTSPQFNDIISLLVNDRALILLPWVGMTENAGFGMHEAYERILAHLKSLARGNDASVTPPPEQDYAPVNTSDNVVDS